MEIDKEICKAFCEDLSVRKVPAGLAVGTSFVGANGDPIGFYVVGPDKEGLFHIEDDGMTVPQLIAGGASISDNKVRSETFASLLGTYCVNYDKETFELKTNGVTQGKIAGDALRFVNLIIRMQDILFMAQERAASTFHHDVLRTMRTVFTQDIEILEGESISPELTEYQPDILLRSSGKTPVAVYLCNSDPKVLEALLLHYAAEYEKKIPCSVVGLLETGKSVSQKNRQRASNHLAAVPEFRGEEVEAIQRISKAFHPDQMLH